LSDPWSRLNVSASSDSTCDSNGIVGLGAVMMLLISEHYEARSGNGVVGPVVVTA